MPGVAPGGGVVPGGLGLGLGVPGGVRFGGMEPGGMTPGACAGNTIGSKTNCAGRGTPLTGGGWTI